MQRKIKTYINFRQRKIRTYINFLIAKIDIGTYPVRVYVMAAGTIAPIDRVSFTCPVFLTLAQ